VSGKQVFPFLHLEEFEEVKELLLFEKLCEELGKSWFTSTSGESSSSSFFCDSVRVS